LRQTFYDGINYHQYPNTADTKLSASLNEISVDMPNCTNASIPTDTFIPIFILTRDRVSALRESIDSYRLILKSPYDIIIFGHNSTYPPMLDYLEDLKNHYNITVFGFPEFSWKQLMEEVKVSIETYLEQRPSIQYYVFTDPDIALLRSSSDMLLFFAGILEAYPLVNVEGPHLQISDLPEHYKEKRNVIKWESWFWKKVPFTKRKGM
jgi:hypothetical protein